MTSIRIAIADDHRVVARSLKAYLESFPDLQVGLAGSGEDLPERLAAYIDPAAGRQRALARAAEDDLTPREIDVPR